MRHFKRVCWSAATGLAALLACAHPASAAADPTTGNEGVVELVARQVQASFVDVDGSSGPSQGDEFVNSGDLFRGTEKVGTYGEVCTLTRLVPVDEFDLLCQGSLTFPLGQLTVTGRFTVTGAGPGNIDFAITGGTDRFHKARGFIHAVNISETETQLTVHLSR
ncbi:MULTISPECIES: hypothetical protein [unclassified Streptomyces]|uniref:hypothetical protein n=1 Tax=unclassified Streptomyces TaxID=2593676 RepID=UPI003649533A